MQNFVTVTSLRHDLWRLKYFWISLQPHFERHLSREGEELQQIWKLTSDAEKIERSEFFNRF